MSVARRFLGMIADNAVTTYCLIRMGEGAAVVLFVYLFITFGNGLRFGRVYLHACQVMNLAGFTLVLLLSPFWSQHVMIGTGLMLSLIITPIVTGFFLIICTPRRVKRSARAQS